MLELRNITKYGITIIVGDMQRLLPVITVVGPSGFLMQGTANAVNLETGLIPALWNCEDMEMVGDAFYKYGVKVHLNNTSYSF